MLASHYVELSTLVQKNTSVKDIYSFDLFICLALLKQMRSDLLVKANNEIDFIEILRSNNQLFANNLIFTIQMAEDIYDKFCIKSNTTDDLDTKQIQHNSFTAQIKKLREIMFN